MEKLRYDALADHTAASCYVRATRCERALSRTIAACTGIAVAATVLQRDISQ